MKPDISYTSSPHSLQNSIGRFLWGIVWTCFYRPSPRPFHAWRRMILRLFGAKIGKNAHPYPSARVWAPWHLRLGENSSIGDWVDVYDVHYIHIGNNVTISQYAFLCTATHDPTDPAFTMVCAPIDIGDNAWICADAFVAPGVKIGQGAVVGARASAYDNVEPWTIVVGNPAKFLKKRELKGQAKPHPIEVSS